MEHAVKLGGSVMHTSPFPPSVLRRVMIVSLARLELRFQRGRRQVYSARQPFTAFGCIIPTLLS